MSQGIKDRTYKISVLAGQVQTEEAIYSHCILKCTPLQEAAGGEGANSLQLMCICKKTTRQRAWKKENILRPKYILPLRCQAKKSSVF